MDYLSKLVRVMGIDGNSSHIEIYLLEIIASKMGVSRLELVSIVLATATRKNFPGDTGTKVLTSFLKIVIDPKNKQLCDNRDNIKRLFDMMAQNIPQQENEEEDQTTFVKAMNAATSLLMENSLLSHEFSSMGIDFKALLITEREQAIRRWIRRSPF